LERLEFYPNIHADSAGVRFFGLLERLIERVGARKLLFGSDGLWLHPAVELRAGRGMLPRPKRSTLSNAAT
jgi:uncharacterized protein